MITFNSCDSLITAEATYTSFCSGYDLESANFSATDEKVLFLHRFIEAQKVAEAHAASLGDINFYSERTTKVSVMCMCNHVDFTET